MAQTLSRAWLCMVMACTMMGAAAMAAPVASGASEPGSAIGHTSFELVDPSRVGVLTGAADEPREVVAYAWYPASPAKARSSRPYLTPREVEDQARSMERNFHYRPGEFASVASRAMAETEDADPLPGRFPIVVFAHGFFSYPEQNSFLAEHLARHGYVVVALGHLHDAVDLRLRNGWLMSTLNPPEGGDHSLSDALGRIAGRHDMDARVAALPDYPAVLKADRLGRSLEAWVDDTRFVADAIAKGDLPPLARRLLAGGDRSRMVFAGMSFGGTTAITVCELVPTCVAAVDLDGEAFDPATFDRPLKHPLLMLHSDWTRYPLWPDQSPDPGFNPNDLAFERWRAAGRSPDVLRLRLVGARHMAFTDLPLLLRGPDAVERFGTIPPERALAAIDAITLAFLDHHAKGRPSTAIDAALARFPELVRHRPDEVERWARHGDKDVSLPCTVGCGP